MRTTSRSHSSFIITQSWIADWDCPGTIRFLLTARSERSLKIFIARQEWLTNWVSILWTSSIATGIWVTNFSAHTSGKGGTADVLRIARDSCGKWCRGFVPWRREFASVCGFLHLIRCRFNLIPLYQVMENSVREFRNFRKI